MRSWCPRALGPWVPQDWVGPPPRGPTIPDEGCLQDFVLGTVAALLALVLSVFYPLVSQSRWRRAHLWAAAVSWPTYLPASRVSPLWWGTALGPGPQRVHLVGEVGPEAPAGAQHPRVGVHPAICPFLLLLRPLAWGLALPNLLLLFKALIK
uniref:Uncharacterized protein n=1 Tax=Oryctolagus cuniculus TaxID=9986 RepID=A0A5F9CZS5_RABIT